jgi:hypothetical protein
MVTAALRWLLIAYGAFLAIATIVLDLRGLERFDPPFNHTVLRGVAVVAVCLAVGAVFRHPIGWAAGLLLSAFFILEPVLPLRDRPKDVNRASLYGSVAGHLILLGLLLSSAARHVFRVGAP